MVSVRASPREKKLASHGMSRTKLTSQLWGETWELGEAAKSPVVNAKSILRGGKAVVDGWCSTNLWNESTTLLNITSPNDHVSHQLILFVVVVGLLFLFLS